MQSALGFGKYGPVVPYGTPTGASSGAAKGAVTNAQRAAGSESMLWLFGIGAVTIGLVAFSTQVRVGKITASLKSG